MKRIILITFLTFFLFSCGSKSNKKTEAQQRDVEQKSRLETLNNLATHYGAVLGFDTLRFSLTYLYQNFLNENNKIILDKFEFCDVTKKDSAYIVSLEIGYYSKLFIDLTCNESQVQELLAGTSKKNTRRIRSSDKFIIATINSIHKIKYQINSDVVSHGDEDPTVYLELDASYAFLCKGKLIDVYNNSK